MARGVAAAGRACALTCVWRCDWLTGRHPTVGPGGAEPLRPAARAVGVMEKPGRPRTRSAYGRWATAAVTITG